MTANVVTFDTSLIAGSPHGYTALRVQVHGVVHGVGFRPFVHRLATRHALGGWVRDASGDVQIEIHGSPESLLAFLRELEAEAPHLARIDSVDITPTEPTQSHRFEILTSAEPSGRWQSVFPDAAMCPACEAELYDPANRRYRHPFITCADCGPRFTLMDAMPHHRERTSMGVFRQCPECQREYERSGDRRYHSETNSCHACGPAVWIVPAGEPNPTAHGARALDSAARFLRLGLIVAIRGLGGFHLAVDATSEPAVRRLRERKRRDAKPLAVMVRTVEEARHLAVLADEEERLLRARERPIVLARQRKGAEFAPSVAPGLDTVGIMTAYTPLHHLLLDLVKRPLVMTGGNIGEEPILTANDAALKQLGSVADAFLLHDREVVSRYDDSVVRVVDGAPVFLRRARGYAPLPVPLPFATPVPIVAVGPHLKHTFTLAHEDSAYVSQHIGDLENLETLEHFRETLVRYRRLFHIAPRVVVRDRHPGYLSTSVASELGLRRIIAVQHHHAHVAAVAGEHGVTSTVVGIAFDGTGYGDDRRVWGAEVLTGNLTGYSRFAHLRYAPLPGGDLAVRRPWRVALGYLSLEPQAWPAFRRAFDGIPISERRIAEQQIQVGLNAPLASSMGRLFDAAAAVLGVRHVCRYEGQAAMEIEALAGRRRAKALPFPVIPGESGGLVLDPIPLLVALGERRMRGDDVALLAARFHESVAAATTQLARRASEHAGVEIVTLGGGVFQNARLLSSTRKLLEGAGLRVFTPRRLGPNDGAISYGQAVVATALLRQEGL